VPSLFALTKSNLIICAPVVKNEIIKEKLTNVYFSDAIVLTLDEYQEVNAVQLKNIDRMITLVDDFMMFSEEEILINDHINVKECLEAVIDDLKPLMDKKKLELEVKVDDLYIMSNKSLFSRLLYNLINNAIKYNKDNGKIYITLEDMRLSIRDTGIGIDDEHIKHIFEPLYCVDKSRSRELGGSGIGLAIVRNICKTLGYKVEVYSKIGYGTEFVIKL
jgi:two-component system phosphate regulon sensor histidine kinase PhoR